MYLKFVRVEKLRETPCISKAPTIAWVHFFHAICIQRKLLLSDETTLSHWKIYGAYNFIVSSLLIFTMLFNFVPMFIPDHKYSWQHISVSSFTTEKLFRCWAPTERTLHFFLKTNSLYSYKYCKRFRISACCAPPGANIVNTTLNYCNLTFWIMNNHLKHYSD